MGARRQGAIDPILIGPGYGGFSDAQNEVMTY
jgi:hypothetical protein